MGTRTWTVFSDAEGVGSALAELLADTTDATVTGADTLESAFESDSEMLVLELDGDRRSERLSAARVASLQARRLVVTGSGARWLCTQLDLEIGGGMISPADPLRVIDAGLPAGESPERVIEPFARPQRRDDWSVRQDLRSLAWNYVPDELRLKQDGGFIEIILGIAREERSAVVSRQANCVFAGVTAHPEEWSTAYREFFRRTVATHAERDLEQFKIAMVPRQIHPPGTARFDLDPLNDKDADYHHMFHLDFDRPTVLTAVLRHSGSRAAMLFFGGGRKGHHATRVDTEHSETLTIAVTVGQPAIDAMAGRYWFLDVTNFDPDNAMSARLTVRYDAVEGGAIQPMPSDASFEHFHWFAERLDGADASARCQATAAAFGFDDWQTLQSHVKWREPWLMKDGAEDRDRQLARAEAKFGQPLGLAEFMQLTEDDEWGLSADLRQAVEQAFDTASRRRHAAVGVEHLLLALVGSPVAEDALTKCGADLAQLRRDLEAALATLPTEEGASVSRPLFGVLLRANFYSALGREGCNGANVLVGVFAEECRARELLERQGLRRQHLMRYLAHGIAAVPPGPRPTSGVLAPALEAVVHAAFTAAAEQGHEAFGVDHLLLALVLQPEFTGRVASPVDRRRMRDEFARFVASTPSAVDGETRPTRALNRVMQQAIARARAASRSQADAASMLRAVATESRTFAADVLRRYDVPVA